MSDKSTTQDSASLSVSTPLGKDALILREFSGTEAVSDLFDFTLVMQSATGAMDLDLTQLVGQHLTVTLTDGDGAQRIVDGICTRVVQTATSYVAELRPWLWMLGLASDNRIYQSQTAVDIIKAVFGNLGYTDFKDSTTATYTTRDYCVQYGESCLNFVSRLMEEEGICYFFTHTAGTHTLVLADDSSAFAAIAGTSTVPYLGLPRGKDWIDGLHLTSCSLEQAVTSGGYQADDYNFTTPATELKASVTGTPLVYDYPGNYTSKDQGDAAAAIRLAALQAGAKRLSGSGVVRAFTAGQSFTLSGHPRSDLNAEWVLHAVSHRATFREYENSFTALPSATTYRPPRRTPAPRIAGTQTAVVVGKSGKEIYTDQYGRVKVQFHWDQQGSNDENSSCWVRVAQGWAGKSWGSFFLPRVGMEVIVSFLDGNPDQPIVTGCVYNGTNTTPYTLTDDQTKSTIKSNSSEGGNGFNEIRFEDKADAEEIFVQAQKDMTVLVNNGRTTTVDAADDTLTLNKGNRSVTITKGNDTLTVSEGNRTSSIAKGNETHSVKGTRDVTVTGAETRTNSDAFTQTVSKDFTLTVDGDITISASGAVTIKAGKGLTVQSTQDMALTSSAALTAKATSDATLQGMSATVKADTGATLQGGTTVTVKGSAQATIDGGGMTSVKGGLVQLN
ncbi:type VI secretion system Vgr family protein [Azospirillum agricola]|uniref:type VI secretion system Vgr family protein n=1 Tax=Azospirillum agricola TaxID=1720247 RepID=UPI000A0F14DF|nr:type VI secretion system tip protein TssI/VgrG [Azospirillum agricola]SMH63008.1 type VI secretion system secreted protein VgrG [Azospirillum lipoferum]